MTQKYDLYLEEVFRRYTIEGLSPVFERYETLFIPPE